MDNNKSARPRHKHVKAKAPDGTKIEVDEKMKKLLKALWKLGIETNFSCQGDPKFVDQYEYAAGQYRAYIQMKHSEAALEFLTDLFAITDYLAGDKVSFGIEFSHHPETYKKRITIRFPHKDIKTLTRLARKEFLYA